MITILGAPLGILVGLASGPPQGFATWIVSGIFFSVPFIIIGKLCGWFGVWVFSDNDQMHAFRATNGDSFFDLALGWPFNPDSKTVRFGGAPEPKYRHRPPGSPTYSRSNTPPPSWRFQCDNCGARNPDPHCVCWHCGADYRMGRGTQPEYEVPIKYVPTAEEQAAWRYQCPTCGAAAPASSAVCWNCNADWRVGHHGEQYQSD